MRLTPLPASSAHETVLQAGRPFRDRLDKHGLSREITCTSCASGPMRFLHAFAIVPLSVLPVRPAWAQSAVSEAVAQHLRVSIDLTNVAVAE